MIDTTLNITTTNNGYCVVVGLKKGSGTFKYIIGTEEQAQALGEEMKANEGKLLFKQQELFIDIKPCLVKKCSSPFCDKLTQEVYCLRCEDLMFDAQQEAQEQRQEQEVLCNGY